MLAVAAQRETTWEKKSRSARGLGLAAALAVAVLALWASAAQAVTTGNERA